MPQIPRLKSPDSTLAALFAGYEFISEQRRALGSDVFEGRLLGRRALFMAGSDAAQLFYDASHFRRADAVPRVIQKTLFGVGGVQGLDGAAHRERKALFVSTGRAAFSGACVAARCAWRPEAPCTCWPSAGKRLGSRCRSRSQRSSCST